MKPTTERTLVELLITLILFMAIGLAVNAFESCTRQKPNEEQTALYEMMEYHSAQGYTAHNDGGYLRLTR